MIDSAVVEIEGLTEFRRDLRRVDRRLATDLQRELKKAAVPMRDDARARYYRFYTRRTGRSPYGIKSAFRRGGVALTLGDARRPYLLGQEWGSPTVPQFSRGGGFGAGLFFWPAYEAGRDRVAAEISQAMDRAVDVLAGRVG